MRFHVGLINSMGNRDHCCVLNCTNRREKSKKSGIQLSFFKFPSGKTEKAKHRRSLWLQAIRRKGFTPTTSTVVCGIHFVSGMAINDSNSIDYVPSLHVGYGKPKQPRFTNVSKRARYWATTDIAATLTEQRDLRRQIVGLATPEPGAEETVGVTADVVHIQLPAVDAENETPGADHAYAKPWDVLFTTTCCTASQTKIQGSIIKELEQTIKQQASIIDRQNAEISHLKDEVQQLKEQVKEKPHFHPNVLLTNDKAVQFYTGFVDRNTYDAVFSYVASKAQRMHYWDGDKKDYDKPKTNRCKAKKLSIEVEFLAVMVRLKVGLFTHDIAQRTGISTSQFTRIFTSWVRLLKLELSSICRFPSRHEVKHFMHPEALKYKNLRVIIDCTEFFIETPSSLTAQRETWSSYKNHNTLKVLVACTPDGVLCYISRAYGGAASDKYITTDCGFLDYVESGDHIMADKGFDIQAEITKKGAFLNLPPFRNPGECQFSKEETEKTKRIAEVRIHVERLIGRIKSYHLLDGKLSLSLQYMAEDIIHTCAYFTLFQSPIISNEVI